ncbi:CDP-glucose 4,6-dehydratase [Sphingomonas sp. GCM10030256]|uniref:CDP-glucose 4,6-dehydratase n=1 Tax=Sphingomonas sp. GCM10030256 TaxID=3273427 RepID=UPI003611123E
MAAGSAVEVLVNPESWRGRRVLVTGHTGFKGGWLSLWLHKMGAQVIGLSLPAPTEPSFFEQTGLAELIDHRIGDVRDESIVREAIADARPEVVLHLAAQPLVRYSYDNPVETYATNVMGTVHVLEACRHTPSVKAVVSITTDKCYENREWIWPYRENDPMGGYDPYSSSKGAAELVISAYRRSYPDGPSLASVRAGNVIGGGDWALDRLVPDIVRAMLAGRNVEVRNPNSVRPWQHVLEALGGYLIIAGRLLQNDRSVATAYNFGPSDDDTQPVSWVVEKMLRAWGGSSTWVKPEGAQPHEATLLRLDCSKARAELNWKPRLRLEEALAKVVEWHKEVDRSGDARTISLAQIEDYQQRLASA